MDSVNAWRNLSSFSACITPLLSFPVPEPMSTNLSTPNLLLDKTLFLISFSMKSPPCYWGWTVG